MFIIYLLFYYRLKYEAARICRMQTLSYNPYSYYPLFNSLEILKKADILKAFEKALTTAV